MAMTNNNPSPAVSSHDSNDPFPDIEARPLQLPDFVNLRAKNPNVSLRWVNRAAGDGQRLDEMTFAGFIPVKPFEICMPDGKEVLPSFVRDGKIIRGDLILMKISRVQYEGALKYNWKRAVNRLHPSTQLKNGQAQLSKGIRETGVPSSIGRTLASKLQAFRPGAGDKTADPNFLGEDTKLPSEKKEE